MRRRTVLAMPLALAACGREEKKSSQKIKIAFTPSYTVSQFYAGYEAGYFRDAGFDIDLDSSSSAQSIPLLAEGKIDAALLSASPALVNAALRGSRIKVVAARECAAASCSGSMRMYVSRKAFPNGILDMHPLRGKTIGNSSLFSQFCIDEILRASQMTEKDVRFERLDAGAALVAVSAGKVDAVYSSNDMATIPAEFDLAPGPRLAETLPDHQFGFILFGPSFLDAPVSVGAKFLKAYFRGTREFLGGKTPQYLLNLAKENHWAPGTEDRICRQGVVKDGVVRMQDLRTFAQWCFDNKHTDRLLDPAMLVDNRYLDAASGGQA